MSGERVLVVDDELEVVQVCTRTLSGEGYQVRGANGGKEALACLEEEQFDLLLVDFLMPEVDGLAVLRRARELDPGVTAIVITAHGTLKNAIDSLQAGARGFLLKPFDLDGLSLAVSEALEERQREQEYLYLRAQLPILEIGQALMAEGDVAGLAKQLLKIVVRQVGADRASLMLLDEETDELYVVGAIGLPVEGVEGRRVPAGRGVAGQALRGGKPLVLGEETSLGLSWGALTDQPKVAASVCVPLRTTKKAVGLLDLGRLDGQVPFTASEVSLLSIISNQIATALDNVRLYEAVAQHNRELAMLNRAGQTLNSSLDLDLVLITVLEEVRRLLSVVACSVWLLDAGTGELVCRQASGPHSEVVRGWRLPPGIGLAGWAASRGESLIVPDVLADERHFKEVDRQTGLALRSILSVPLRIKENVIGVLQVVDAEVDRFRPAELTLVESLAASAATAIENARLFERTWQEIAERERTEAALYESEEKYRRLVEEIDDVIYTTDEKGVITYISPAIESLSGYDPSEIIGRPFSEFIHQEDLSGVEKRFQEAACGRVPESDEYRIATKSGEIRWVRASTNQPIGIEGRVLGFQGVMVDITERVQAEEALRQRNRELALLNRAGQALNSTLDLDQVFVTILDEVRHLLDVVACSVWLIDPETDEVVCRQSTGPRSEVVRGWRLAPGEGISGWVARTRESLIVPDAQGDERYFAGVDQATGLPLHSVLCVPLRVKDEVIGVLQVVDTEIDRFGPPDLTLVESLAASAATAIENARLYGQAQQEIAERKRAEEEVQRRNEELAALNTIVAAVSQSLDLNGILNAALDETLAVLNVEGGLICLFDEASQAFRPAAHRGLSQALLREVTGFKLGEGLSGRVARNGEPLSVPDLAKDTRDISPAAIKDGWQSLASVPLKAKGGTAGVMTVVSGAKAGFGLQSLNLLTAIGSQIGVAVENVQLAAEAAEVEILRELDRLRSELIANVSHELRTPLGLIKVFATSLLMEDVEFDRETQLKFLQGIDEETDRLETIVDNLLNLSRVESGRLRLDKRPTDLGQLVAQLIEAMKMDIQPARHRFVCDFPSEPLVATVDVRGIEQVLRNLLSNAVKYSPGGGNITVHGHRDKWQVLVAVSDEGIGIPSEDLERVFERFYRVDNETTKSVGGVGLGLAVCRSIVEAHGGRIWVESTLGRGSSFYFTVPAGRNRNGSAQGRVQAAGRA